jgi:hypothetical protein
MRIDDWLKELGRQEPDRPLLGLETRVWAAIGERQRAPSGMTLWGWRSAAAALLLTIGLLTQGASLAEANSEFELFSPRAALAPSTLLGESR